MCVVYIQIECPLSPSALAGLQALCAQVLHLSDPLRLLPGCASAARATAETVNARDGDAIVSVSVWRDYQLL